MKNCGLIAVGFIAATAIFKGKEILETAKKKYLELREKALKEAKDGKLIGYEQDVKYGNIIYEVTILDGKTEKEYKIDG